MKYQKYFSVLVILAFVVSLLPAQSTALGAGTVSLTAFSSAYTQDFNTLASSGASDVTPDGWWFIESGTNANTTYAAGTGSSNTGNTYSFGATDDAERAFGGLRSGNLVPLIGASFANDTGGTITALSITYTGEQWRLGNVTSGRLPDRLDFQLSTNATALNDSAATWVDYDALDFSSPVISGTVGALNGNDAANRTDLAYSITGLTIPNGASFWVRWVDVDISGADDGLSIDDFSLTPEGSTGDLPPAVESSVPADGAVDVAVDANLIITFTEAVDMSGSWLALNCTSSGAHTVTVSDGPTTFILDPDIDFANSETCTATITAALVSDQDANDPPDTMDADYSWSFTTVSAAMAADLVINEIDYDQPGTDTAEFIEILNKDSVSVDLSSYTLQLVNGNAGGAAVYRTYNLPATMLAAGDYFVVCANNTTVANCDLDVTPDTDLVQNGAPDAVGLLFGTTLIDAVSYEGDTGAPYTEGSGIGLVDTAAAGESISRCPDGTDTDQNNVDFVLRNITPGAANACIIEQAPYVASTSPANGATGIARSADVAIDFSEAVNVTGSWYTISCASSGVHTAAVSGGPVSYTLNPDVDFYANETCTVTVNAALVSDQDADDPPDTMAADHSFGFTTADVQACGDPATLISAVQGSGLTSPIIGSVVTVEGVVVSDLQGAGQFSGYHMQEEDVDVDGNPATSEGIFIYNTGYPVSVGDKVRVTGKVMEYETSGGSGAYLTELGSVSNVIVCSTGNSVTPATVSLPVANLNDWESYESMLVSIPQDLTVTEHYTLGRYGEVSLSANGRLFTPTNVVNPGPPALELQDLNNRSRILLDDANNQQNIDPIRYPEPGGLSAVNTLRTGYTVHGLTGVLEQRFSVYRIQPVGAVSFDGTTNPRPASAPVLTGDLRVAGMNLLNFFNTFGAGACTLGVGGGATDCRGAENAEEFARQWPKTVAAIVGAQADVIGVIEIENDGYGSASAIQFLVDKLNEATAPGTYASVDVDAATGQVNALGTDAIKVGVLYRPARVTPVGQTAALNSIEFVNGGDGEARNRPALAQAFEQNSNGARFVVSVNHLKSKGSACDLPDQGDGQGNCNTVRVNAANALTTWLASDPTGTGVTDILIMGDLNSYAKEDPITAIKSPGYANLIYDRLGAEAYSYVYDGQSGYLDHALGSNSIVSKVTGVADWHINADEPSSLDYNTNYKSAGQLVSLYAPDEFRISDHDPVLVDLRFNSAPAVDAGGPYSVPEGSSVTLSATGSDPDGDALTYAWDLNNDGVFETAGQTVEFSAAGLDGPGSRTVAVQVTDEGGLSAADSATVNVTNAAPILGAINAPTLPVKIKVNVSISAAFSDPGMLDTHTATINWGDGVVTAGTVSETNGSGTVSGTHKYTKAGLYNITMTLTDKDGASATQVFEYVVIYNPSGGFVTGGGWFKSPAGAYLANPSATGTATFALVARYKKSSSVVPSGVTTFIFHAGPMVFQSSSYEWLVVNGKTAEFKGVGWVNGVSGYKFRVTAIDGRPDKFRIRIWSGAAEGEGLIYDNGTDQPLKGGNIIVQK
jgi:predicted extracellular nuclease